MSEHTPGPWTTEGADITNGYPEQGARVLIAEKVFSEHDAALIAAAPAMYEALKEWCDYYAAYNPIRDKRIEPFIKLTRQALAQAEGK